MDIRRAAPGARARRPSKRDYRLLSELRYLIRRFLGFSQAAAARAGLTARQHQALLALKGAREDSATTVGYLAERLLIRHQSAVELADRLEEAGLIRRAPDANDRRRVLLALTDKAERRLALLSSSHIAELKRLRPALLDILDQAEKIEHGARG
jgi:DNA-binding MarR family transcriptional regulator